MEKIKYPILIGIDERVTLRSSPEFNERKLFVVGNTVIEGIKISCCCSGTVVRDCDGFCSVCKSYSTYTFKNRKLNGPSIGLDQNGKLSFECNYLNGEYDGLLRIYMHGKVIVEAHYDKGKKLEPKPSCPL